MIAPAADNKLLSKRDACRLTGASASYLTKLRQAGQLRTYRTTGGHHKFYTAELKAHFALEKPHAQ